MISVIFFGTESFAVSQLEALCNSESISVRAVVTQPPRPTGRKQIITKSPVHIYAESKNIPVLTPQTLKNNASAIDELQAAAADIFIVAQYGLIIPNTVLEIPKFGAVNVHGSLLPAYRGATPVPAAIANGDTETGITFIKMDALLDHGPILGMHTCSIEKTDTTESLLEKLGALAAQHLTQTLTEYISGSRTPVEQDHTAATTTKILSRADGYIDPTTLSAIEIERLMRAYYPWPGITIGSKNHTLKLIKGTPTNTSTVSSGTLFLDKKKIVLGTKSGDLELEILQLSGKSIMTAAQFIPGNLHLSGEVFTKITLQ